MANAESIPTVRTRGPPLPKPLFEYVVNPLVRRLLRSRFHGWASDEVLLITVTGRRTGREYTTPVGYELHEGALYVTSLADHTWWRNCRGGAPVTVHLRGERRTGAAEIIEETAEVVDYVDGFIERHGVDDVGRLSIAVDGESRPDRDALEAGLDDLVLVRIELNGGPVR